MPMVDEPQATPAETGWYRHLDLVATVVLAVATVLTAWSAFQSSQWSGVQAAAYSAASRERAESNRAQTLAGQQSIIDVMLFTDWLDALHSEGDTVVVPDPYVPDPTVYSGFLFERFRPEFRPAVHAWLAEEPLTNPAAPPSPFAMDEYVLASAQEAARLEKASDRSAATARLAIERKDNYVLATVLCASVLFFCGIGSKLGSPRRRAVMIAIGGAVLLATLVVVLTFPVHF
ncbi:hypothetical protein [Cellulomonas sp. ICMP 17802]|uniref:hypothetical protein n=1 Tax=Cellulomonas sp. ICMP 17802 TaxID=3239199 RepID=UPI00351AF227